MAEWGGEHVGAGGQPLPQDEVHLYLTDDTAVPISPELAAAAGVLSEEERARGARFLQARHRHQFLVARLLVRTTLSRYVPQIGPEAWQFDITSHGRPLIRGALGETLHFNLSHTQGCVVIAVARASRLGVDVEWRNPQTPGSELAQRFFAPEEALALGSVSEQEQSMRFFDLWTLKEAYVKAQGLGFSLPFNDFVIGFSGGHGLSLSWPNGSGERDWHMWTLDAGSGHSLALALGAAGAWGLRQFRGAPLSGFGEVPCRILRSLEA